MPEELDAWPHKEHGNQKHDYATWLDGTVRRLTRGIDYDCTTRVMRQLIYRQAHQRGIKARVRAEGDASLIVQAKL